MINGQEEGQVVVTVTRRLARWLAQQWDQQALARGERVWRTPQILPWGGWLNLLWSELLDRADDLPPAGLPRVLSDYEEKCLWLQAIQEDGAADGLLDGTALARHAMDAERLLLAWQVVPDAVELLDHLDGQAFLRWRRLVARRCQRQGWALSAGLPLLLTRWLDRLTLPGRLTLEAFDDHPPSHRQLLWAMAGRGVSVAEEAVAAGNVQAWRLALPDGEGEIRTAANWARQQISQRGQRRIGVVVANLAAIKGAVQRIFLEVFDAPGLLQGGVEPSRAFALSLGEPLNRWPMTRDALFLLSLAAGEVLELVDYGVLLHSPYLQGAEREGLARSGLDAWLRRQGRRRLSLMALAALGQEQGTPVLALGVKKFLQACGETPGLLPPSQWAERFAQWLVCWGWPGDRAPGSADRQLLESWREMLTVFRGLDGVLGVIPPGEALSHLTALAAETLFLPESADTPVQVMGVLEAAGLTFDGLWLLGFTEESWPPAAGANPLLPARWQREHQLPNASPQQRQQVAERHFRRLLAAAPRVVVSHAAREGDREVRMTPMAAQLPELPREEWPSLQCWPAGEEVALERFEDWQATPLPGEATHVGGSGLFKSQAVCPFQAFARYRLKVRQLPDPQPGLDPGMRGEVVHWVFESFWGLVASKETLLAMDDEALARMARRAASHGVARLVREHGDLVDPPFQEMEIDRMQGMLLHWAAMEKERETGFQVMSRERGDTLEIGGLSVTLRPDRVDRLEAAGLAVVDYKTRSPGVSGWFGERLEEPQLPLYGLLRRETVDALAFAVTRPGEMKFEGLSRNPGVLPGVKSLEEARANQQQWQWPELLDHWQRALENLAAEFKAGHALPAPLTPAACSLCDLARLCRIGEKENQQEGEDEQS